MAKMKVQPEPREQPKSEALQATAKVIDALYMLSWPEKKDVLTAALALLREDSLMRAIQNATT